MTVLGGCGAWPAAGQACSGYLIESSGFRLLVDPGYATLPRLLTYVDAAHVDAVLVSHEHPDHCADLNPLLRARALRDDPPPPLPVHALPGALDAILALDHRMLTENRHTYDLHTFSDRDQLTIGPFVVDVRLLPHFVTNAGFRITGSAVLAYTGDCGPDPGVVELAHDADALVAEATYVDEVSDPSSIGLLSTARDAAWQANAAGARRLMLTHLWPGTAANKAISAAREHYPGPLSVAAPGVVLEI
ncbi:MAG TPA: MBL fold metallo-hydrolase [Jatrophihabitantaceae bacterium]|jgi:ribonuclease BN (tRNA processing enzyme)